MKLTVEIFSSYERTYKPIINDVMRYLYDFSISETDYEVFVDDISENGTLSIQAQRSKTDYPSRTIRVYENMELKHIVALTNTNFDEDKEYEFINHPEKTPKKKSQYGVMNYHANTYLVQGIANIFDFYFKNKKTADLTFYLLDTKQSYPHNLYNILSYRELETIGFKVLNADKIDFSLYKEKCKSPFLDANSLKFSDFDKLIRDIAHISNKNSGNNPSFLQCEEQMSYGNEGQTVYTTLKYIYTFKSLSAQGYDSLIKCWCMKVLADKEGTDIEFVLGKQYFAYEEEKKSVADKLTGPIQKAFEQSGINITYLTNEAFMDERRVADDTYLRYKANRTLRNQTLFRKNLRIKGIPFECCVCGETNKDLLDAAHIWEVNAISKTSTRDINNFIRINNIEELLNSTSKYKDEIFFKKYSLVNSGDNGVWLCKNHHKLFDSNYFCFDSDNGKILLHFENPVQAQEFASQFEDVELGKGILTPTTKAFLYQRQLIFYA